jgi:hypothetical protein
MMNMGRLCMVMARKRTHFLGGGELEITGQRAVGLGIVVLGIRSQPRRGVEVLSWVLIVAKSVGR